MKNVLCIGPNSSGNLFIENESFPQNKKINIRNTYTNLYRYLEDEFAKQFLETGRLRISPLTKYHNEILKERSDKTEGSTETSLFMNNKIIWKAADGYCLCLSRFPTMHLKNKFASDCIKISRIKLFNNS